MAKRIVVCGTDQTLVETRRAILSHAGYEVSASTAKDVVPKLVNPHDADLLVLCSSLSYEERQLLVEASHKIRPGQKSLIVVTGGEDDLPPSAVDVAFYAFQGPSRFVESVNSLLEA